MITFSTSGPMGPQLTRIVQQVGQNLPQVVMREIQKIVRALFLPYFHDMSYWGLL